MQTLTITDARKNLGRLLRAAARGKDIGIISGADVIALRKVESTDYAQSEYGASDEQVENADRAIVRRFQRLKRLGRLTITTDSELKNLFRLS